jgi:16S rRNA (cytosine1402-N4)-methyltransferase
LFARGLQVSEVKGRPDQPYVHRPVMVDLIVEILGAVPAGTIVDATVGGGGHAEAILDAHPHLTLLGLDRDLDAIAAAHERLARFGDRVILRHARFDRMTTTMQEAGITDATGALFDLGVSSPQLDHADRGFSYRADGPLDMRMDRTQPLTAAGLINDVPERELATMLRELGDERFADRVARAIVAARPIASTAELAEIVRDAIPAATRRRGGHPAKRTFQAIRIAVNDELTILAPTLDAALEALAPGGRCAVLAYHSGEDRIVKGRFRNAASGGWTGPSYLPRPAEVVPGFRLLKAGAWKPTPKEVEANPRAESARLRAVEKLGTAS